MTKRLLLFILLLLPSFLFCFIGLGNPDKQAFSVWLIPRAYEKSDYQKCINDLARSHGINREDWFVPHITIYYGKSADCSLQNITNTVKKIAENNNAPTLEINGICAGRDRFKSLYLTFTKTDDLVKLNAWSKLISGTDGVDGKYTLMPHLSLFYPAQGTELKFTEKANMLLEVCMTYDAWFNKDWNKNEEFKKGFEIKFDSIWVIKEEDDNKVHLWQPIDNGKYMIDKKK